MHEMSAQMRVSGWNNGHKGYGISVGRPNRDRYFSRSWSVIEVEIDRQFHEFPLTGGFWQDCPEFRGARIGEWLRTNGFAPWPRGKPPKFELVWLGENHFRLILP
jgi:hypothetical protein